MLAAPRAQRGGVVGTSHEINVDGRPVAVGEYARVLFEQERAERQNVASLAERIAKPRC